MSGDEQLSVDGYIRVSRVGGRKGERFISPSVQRKVIAAWAAANDVRLLEVFEELDRSGRGDNQPLLDAAVRRVEEEISQGIVVARVTRFGRSLLSGIATIERVAKAGGRFVAIENNLDTSTDTGRLVLHILLALAEWDGDRIRTDWGHARASAIRRGVYMFAGSPVWVSADALGGPANVAWAGGRGRGGLPSSSRRGELLVAGEVV